jgi:hypothetical protein
MHDQDKPRGITDILKEVDEITSTRNPTIEYYLGIDAYFKELTVGVQIIRGYVTGAHTYDVARMEEDLLKLSGIHVSTAECVGYIQGYARRTEETRKITKSKYALKIRNKQNELEKANKIVIKVNDADLDNASRVLASETYMTAADAETVSNMMKTMWYAIGDFIKILNSAINREHRYDMGSGEGARKSSS